MSQKPDYYEVLGISKSATTEEIKRAYQKIVMRCHPDRVKTKTDLTQAQKDELIQKFKDATEAEKVLTDSLKRTTYDKYGHKGLENLAAGKSGGSGQTYADVAGPVHRKSNTAEDALSFFEKRAAQREREKTQGGGTSGQEAVDREAARLERQKRRRAGKPSSEGEPPTATEEDPRRDFEDVAGKVNEAAERLADPSGMAEVPLDVLIRFRENLADFISSVDQAIARARSAKKPGFGG